VNIQPGGEVQRAVVNGTGETVAYVGLAITDVEVLISAETVGPGGRSQGVYVQADDPLGEGAALHPGDMWIKKPPDAVPQPTFVWDGAVWNQISA